MPTLNEAKYTALLAITGATPPITLNELECLRLEQLGYSGTLNEMWMQEFKSEGFTGNFNEAASGYLSSFGFFGTLNERWYQFWTNGGSTNPNLVINSRFLTDSDWVKGLGWTIAGGTANCDGSQLSTSDLAQAVPHVATSNYRLRYDIVGYAIGTLTPTAGGVVLAPRIKIGTYVEKYQAINNGGLSFQASANFVGKIDNVYIVEE